MAKAKKATKPTKPAKGKSVIMRHDREKASKGLARGNEKNIELIEKHITKHIGPYTTVFHEIISEHVHIDVHMVPPTKKRPMWTLVTSGMSDKSMNVPKGAEELQHAELMLCLPPDWPMEQKKWNKKTYWPIEFLKFLARMPHVYDTWLYWGHTIPQDETVPCFPGTKLCCALVAPPFHASEKFMELKVNKKTILFHAVYFLYREEMDFKMEQGFQALYERLDKGKVTELVEVERKSCVK